MGDPVEENVESVETRLRGSESESETVLFSVQKYVEIWQLIPK